jgi:glutamine amidotransferase
VSGGGAAPRVVVLDYGFGNVRSAVRAVQRVGAQVELTADHDAAMACDGLIVPGVGAFAAVIAGLRAVRGDRLVDRRLAGGRAVLGICVGLQVMFERSTEHGHEHVPGLGEWPGVVERLPAAVVPHMGWNTVQPPAGTRLFKGVEDEMFYFVHSFAVQRWDFVERSGDSGRFTPPAVTWAEHGSRFVAAVENGPLSATQFHPEKSGDAGAHLLENWVRSLG